MKKYRIIVFCLLVNVISKAQDPYIGVGSGQGIGQYAYIEKNAVSFANLYRNTYNNVEYLAARFWVDAGSGVEWIYYTNYDSNNWQCGGNNDIYKSTQNFDPSNFGSQWIAGANVYVSVRSGYCGGATGGPFNERHFQIFDFEVKNDIPSGSVFDADGNCSQTTTKGNNIVGSFTIDIGSLSSKTLERLFFSNSGSFSEGVQIPNNGFKLFFEPSTGSETFDGSESSVQLYGDWGGNSTSNNEYGADNMNIPLSGITRFYVVLCDIVNGSVNPLSIGSFPDAVNLNILNDGLSLGPSLDAKTLARINQTSLNLNSPFPVKLLNFKANSENQLAHLSWETTEETNNESFEIQRSANAIDFVTIGQLKGNGTTNVEKSYKFTDISPINGQNYYRLKQNDKDGKFEFSKIISLKINTLNERQVIVFPNPSNNGFRVNNLAFGASVSIMNVLGKKVLETIAVKEFMEFKSEDFDSGTYFLNVKFPDGKQETRKLIIEK
ncbi:T9SS C-terminal target domain-containing protein [Lacihabitans sp. LS3-19]|uniref:T9SS type A sorting domain-containing protein n=1 Tax=Lacihabitans sp. LS3-19 TaxID=2487335 RepID=UPI0020CC5790|nr:T9SS type A sorting domain-containing protein [Lacihabitans sp. LS3-19]MCP9770209.1 T9SS C-terminal target domain-containing protein [Lacihabitans sp. LS3-19]